MSCFGSPFRRPTRVALAAAFALGAGAVAAVAAPLDGPVPRVTFLGQWIHHDPLEPRKGYEPWTTQDVLGFLARYPDAVFGVGAVSARPAGYPLHVTRGRRVDELQRLAAQRGVDVDGRLCMSTRFDVYAKHPYASSLCDPLAGGGGCDYEGNMDGSLGEAERVVKASGVATGGGDSALEDAGAEWKIDGWMHRLLVLRPGDPLEEQGRVVANQKTAVGVSQRWQTPPRPGDRYEIRGSFDPAWVKRVPKSEHEESLRRFWASDRKLCGRERNAPCRPPLQPLDPFDPSNTRSWPEWHDREAIEALRTPTHVPALYGWVKDQGSMEGVWEDPYFFYAAFLMDVSDADYRTWSIRQLLYVLRDLGFQPGESVCVNVGVKPGLHTWYDEEAYGPSTASCPAPGTHTWEGPARVCFEHGGPAPGGPYEPTPFGPGEYERAVNAYFRELIRTLAANGYADLTLLTMEQPTFRDQTWSILEPDVRGDRHLVGEIGRWIEPRLSELGADPNPEPPPGGAPPPDDGLGETPGPEPPPAQPPAAPDPPPEDPSAPEPAPEDPTAPGPPAYDPGGSIGGGGSWGDPGTGSGDDGGSGSVPAPDPPESPAPPAPRPDAAPAVAPHGDVSNSNGGSGGSVEAYEP